MGVSMKAKFLYLDSVLAFREHQADVMSNLDAEAVRNAAAVLLKASRDISLKMGEDISIVVTATGGHKHVDFRNATVGVHNHLGGVIHSETIR